MECKQCGSTKFIVETRRVYGASGRNSSMITTGRPWLEEIKRIECKSCSEEVIIDTELINLAGENQLIEEFIRFLGNTYLEEKNHELINKFNEII